MTYFGSRLRCLRKQEELTQQQLADKLGIKKSTISMYENGKREPDFETLESIAEFFNVDICTFFPRNDPPDFDGPATTTDSISDKEIQLIEAYRKATPDDRQIVDLTLKKYIVAPCIKGDPAKAV